jgi:hypothetical protein
MLNSANDAVVKALLSRYPFSAELVINALETGKILQTAMEGSQAESQELEKVLLENDFY